MIGSTSTENPKRVPPTRLPLGYVYGPGKRVVVDEGVMPLVQEARRMREEGHSIRTIRRVTHQKGLRGRTGKRVSVGGMWVILTQRPSVRRSVYDACLSSTVDTTA